MKSFIDSVVEHIIGKFENLQEVEIIVPNNRTGSAILSSLQANVTEVCWAPKITPIADIFAKGTKICHAENIVLVYNLYKVYKEIFGESYDKGFDDFYNFGTVLLSDFDDIDKYLVNPSKLFKNIADEKLIESDFADFSKEFIETLKNFWTNISADSLIDKKIKTLELWEKMPLIYENFQKLLDEKNIGYQGKIYRDFVENGLEKFDFKYKKYAVVGFSALNKCEKQLFKYLKDKYECSFYWDADKYYIKEESHQEAGLFLRENLKQFPLPKGFEISDSIKDIAKKNIEIIEVPSSVAQVKLVPELLESFGKLDGKTAIVLGDEKLLIPLIYSLPAEIASENSDKKSGYNITMGYPLSYTASASFVQIIMKLAMHRSHNEKDKIVYMQRADIHAVIHHCFSRMIKNSEDCIKAIDKKLTESKIEYVNIDNFKDDIAENEFLKLVFDGDLMEKSFPEYVLTNCEYVYRNIIIGENNRTESDFMHKIITLFKAFLNALNGEIVFTKDKMYYKLMQSMIKQSNLAFDGKSDDKMQILGFMETRSLDFDNLIMLSLNENTFPKSNSKESMIPYNLRRAFQMPSIEYQDSIYAYYFYRLLQRSKNIKMLHYSEEKISQAEKSRFITQINYELGLVENKEIHKTKSFSVSPSKPSTICIKKDERIIREIKIKLGCIPDNKGNKKGVYPSSINSYIACPLKFYFQYVEKLEEPENIGDDTSALDFGNLLHNACFYLYENYKGKIIDANELKVIKNRIGEAVEFAITKVFKVEKTDDLFSKAMSNIMIKPLRKYLNEIINKDMEYAPFEIVDLENKDDYSIEYEVDGNKILLKGIIDRIDRKEGKVRVIDYKTSNIDDKKKTYTEDFWSPETFERKEVAQVLVYCEILSQMPEFKNDVISPAIISVRNLKNYDFKCERYNPENPEKPKKDDIKSYKTDEFAKGGTNISLRDDVNANLKKIFSDMLNPEVQITQTTNEKNCEYCAYKRLCNKG